MRTPTIQPEPEMCRLNVFFNMDYVNHIFSYFTYGIVFVYVVIFRGKEKEMYKSLSNVIMNFKKIVLYRIHR